MPKDSTEPPLQSLGAYRPMAPSEAYRLHRSSSLSILSRADRLLARAIRRSWSGVKKKYAEASIASIKEWR
jgi:hypothetical protein